MLLLGMLNVDVHTHRVTRPSHESREEREKVILVTKVADGCLALNPK